MALKLIYTRNCKVFVSGSYFVTQIYWYYDTTFITGANITEGSIVGIKLYYRKLSTGELTLLNAGTYDSLIFNADETSPFNITSGNFAPSLDTYYGYQFCFLNTLVKFSIATADTYPNFELNIFENSPFCTINVFDLTIEHISTNADTGATNGTITVQVLNTYEPTEYSLNGTDWQTSNIFTGLTGDNIYAVWVKDSLGNIKSESVKIEKTDTYNTRWQCQFTNLLNEKWYVDIKEKDYALDALDITLGATPVIINTGSSDGNKFEIIRGSECKLQLISESDFQFSDLFTDDERKYKVVISKDVLTGSVDVKTMQWTGFVLPDIYREPYICVPYIVEVSASDGFGTLKNFDYKFYDGTNYSGILDTWSILKEILNKLNLWLDSVVINSLVETGDTQSNSGNSYLNNPFTFIYVNLEAYEDKDCDFILREILKPFGCRIFQQGGKFWIERINDLAADTVDEFTDTYNNSNPAIIENTSLIIQMTNSAASDATKCVFLNQSQALEILPAWKNSKVKNELMHNTQLIYNGDFTFWDNDLIIGWKKVYPTTFAAINKIQISPDNFGTEITGVSDTFVNANYIVSRKQKLKFSTLDNFNLKIKFYIDSPPNSGTINARMYFQLVYVPPPFTTENYCNYDTSNLIYSFTTDNDGLFISINQESDLNTWREFSLITSLSANTEGYYFVRLFQIVQVLGIPGSRVYNSIKYDYVKLEVNLNENATEIIQEFLGTNFNNISYKPEILDVFHSDAPLADNSSVTYLNPFLLSDNTNTKEWGINQEPILRNLTDTIQAEHRFRTIKLSGTIYSKIFNFSRMIKDVNIPYSLFMVNFESFNIKKSEHEVELIELINYIDGADPSPLYPFPDIFLTEDGQLMIAEDNTGYITLETSQT